MNVIFIPKVLEYFEDLVTILYAEEYFSFLETSKRYVDELVDDIKKTLPTRPHKPAPKYFDKYGLNMYFAAFQKNKHTTWYVFFTKYREHEEEIYLVRYIANNHTVAQHL